MSTPTIKIGDRLIGPDQPPYVIAEMSGNHNGDIDRALAILHMAKEAGADAVKLQTYTADTLTIDHDGDDFLIKGGLWDGHTLYSLYEDAHTPWEWHAPLFEEAARLGITVFSSPFDETAVDFLETLDCPAYKIASFEAVDLELIAKAASTGKPLIISTGMADEREISEALETAQAAGCREVALLHCVSGYPTPADQSNLRTISDLSAKFGTVIGLSDHTLGVTTAIASVALGARIIEKHVTLARADGGPDAAFSLEPDELAALCSETRTAWEALGDINYAIKDAERQSMVFRRSIYAVAPIAAGEPLTRDNVRVIRPGFGLPPRHLPEVLGKTAKTDIPRGTPIGWALVE